jgi:hypothetical protein
MTVRCQISYEFPGRTKQSNLLREGGDESISINADLLLCRL